MSRKLLELAKLREKTIEVAGEALLIREPNGLQMMEYRSLRKTDLAGAVATLIASCVVDEQGNPLYTAEEGRVLANGRPDVFIPLIIALTGFDDTAEKKS